MDANMNQNKTDRKDRNGGGDVSKAEKVAVKSQKQTNWQSVGGHRSATKEG